MKIRYTRNIKGQTVEEARIYDSQKDLSVLIRKVDPAAIHVLRRLNEEGHKSYLVGGAVRDLLLGLTPKDFDIATEAHPHQIKMLFGKRAIIIGKRFRLVHVRTHDKEFIEVVTFRTTREKSFSNNSYGTITEDVLRRDFSMNALFYDPLNHEILDYVKGIEAIRRRIIEPVIPCSIIFKEDPVRMVRMIKYAIKTGFKIPIKLRWQMFLDKAELKDVPVARLMDEILKIFQGGKAQKTFELLFKHRILKVITPNLHLYLGNPAYYEVFSKELNRLDLKTTRSADLMKEDYMKPVRRLGQMVAKNESLDQESILENLFAPIRFTGDWNLALKHSKVRFPMRSKHLPPRSDLPTLTSEVLQTDKPKRKQPQRHYRRPRKSNEA